MNPHGRLATIPPVRHINFTTKKYPWRFRFDLQFRLLTLAYHSVSLKCFAFDGLFLGVFLAFHGPFGPLSAAGEGPRRGRLMKLRRYLERLGRGCGPVGDYPSRLA